MHITITHVTHKHNTFANHVFNDLSGSQGYLLHLETHT